MASTKATRAKVAASTSTMPRIWLRTAPEERSMPISRVRSITENTRVLARPSIPVAPASTSMA